MSEGVGVDAGLGLRRQGAFPSLMSRTDGSASQGAAAVTLANFEENSPKLRCWERPAIRPKAATSQKAVVPPLPRTTR